MFSLKIIDTDLFLDMPASTQLLYFHLSLRADDDGFVSSPKKIMKMVNCSDDDMKILVAKKFIIPFENGICVIRHWRVHNYIQKDRYTATMYKYEKNMLNSENGVYELNSNSEINKLDTKCIQNVHEMDTQDRLGKDRLEKGKRENNKKKKKVTELDNLIDSYTDNEELKETFRDFIKMRKSIKKPMTDKAMNLLTGKLDKLGSTDTEKIELLNQSILNSWCSVFPLKKENKEKEEEYSGRKIWDPNTLNI